MLTSTSRGSRSWVSIVTRSYAAVGVDDGAGDPVLDPLLAGGVELGGEDHLVACVQAVGLAGQLDSV